MEICTRVTLGDTGQSCERCCVLAVSRVGVTVGTDEEARSGIEMRAERVVCLLASLFFYLIFPLIWI